MSVGPGMWLEQDELQRIDSAIQTGRTTDIDRLLAAILSRPGDAAVSPSICAICRRDMIRGELAQLGAIYTCPQQHGAWLDPAAVTTLHGLIARQGEGRRRRRRIRVLTGIFVASLAACALSALLTGQLAQWWPNTISVAERRYLGQLMTLLDQGIRNRRDVEGVLKTPSEPTTYVEVYKIYRERQERVLHQLRGLKVPARLRSVHERIVTATEHQIIFYRAFADARAYGDAVEVAHMLGNSDLRASDYALRRAWDLIRQIYPTLDPRLATAIESRLCYFDPI